jgi:hypothetical protein
MPQLAPAVGAVAGLFGGTGFGAVLGQVLLGVGINLAVGAAINTFFPQEAQAGAAPTGVELEFRAGSDVLVSAIMGVRDTPGHFAYHNSYGNDNEFLQLLFIDGNGEHTEMIGLLADNQAVTLSGSNANSRGFVIDEFTVSGTPNAWVKYYTGAAGQAADPELVARASEPDRWTAACKLTATAYRIVTLRWNPDVFGGVIPSFRAIWKGLKLYDRRKDDTQPGGSGSHRWGDPSTYEWTENAAICQDNWRRGIWVNGVRLLGLGTSEYDGSHAGIVAAANVCAETVYYEDSDVTLPRYVFGAEIQDGTDPISMMRLFEQSMAGHGTEIGGAYMPLPAQTLTPVATLLIADQIPGEEVLEQSRMMPTETKTAYHGVFLSPADGWLPAEYGLRADTVVEALEGGRRQGPLDAMYVRHREIAAANAEIARRRDRFSAVASATYGPVAKDLRPGQVVTYESEVLGELTMMVVSKQDQPRKCFRLAMRQWDNSIVPTPTAGFLPLPVDPIPAPVPPRLTHPLALLAVAAEQVSGTTKVPAIRVTFTPITDRTVERVVVKYWPTANPADVRYASSDEPGSGVMVIEGVVPETEYKLVATVFTNPPRLTTWTNEATVTTSALVAGDVAPEAIQEILQEVSEHVAGQIGQLAQIRSLVEAFKQLGTLIEEVDRENFNKRESRFREIIVQLDDLTASFTEIIEVALGPGGAIATQLESLYAALGGNTSEVNVIWEAQAAPSGYSAKYAIRAQVNDGSFRAATFAVLVPADPELPTEILLDAGRVLFTNGTTTAPAIVIEGGEIKFAGGRAGRITDVTGEKMIVDFDNPRIRMESTP